MPIANPVRLAFEGHLYQQCEGILHFVYVTARPRDLPPVSLSPTGDNPFYNGPIGWAANLFGVFPADVTAILDSDLGRIPRADYYASLDLGEYKILGRTLNSYTQTDESGQDRSQSWNAMASRFQGRLSELEKLYANLIYANVPRVSFGRIKLPIAPNPNRIFGYD